MNYKLLFIPLLALLFSACETKSKVSGLDLLVGSWQMVDEQEGRITYEIWEKKSDQNYEGFGFTLQDTDTVSRELMTLRQNDGQWTCLVQTMDGDAVEFAFTSLTDNAFVCENPENDFPNKISYKLDQDLMLAKISTGEQGIDFRFERIPVK